MAIFVFSSFSTTHSCLSLARAQLAKGRKKNILVTFTVCFSNCKISKISIVYHSNLSLFSLFIYHRFLAGHRLSVEPEATHINRCQQINAGIDKRFY